MKESCYSVSYMTHDKNTNIWSSDVQYTGIDEREALAKYNLEQNRLLEVKDYDVVNVYLLNENGLMLSHLWDERPEPID